MLKSINPYYIIFATVLCAVLLVSGYVKGRIDGANKHLKNEVSRSAEIVKKTNENMALTREVKHEGQNLNHSELVVDMCNNRWMRSQDDCGK